MWPLAFVPFVAVMVMALLEIPDYYEQAKYGYCQGTGAVEYVARVMQTFGNYQALYPRQPVTVTMAETNAATPFFLT